MQLVSLSALALMLLMLTACEQVPGSAGGTSSSSSAQTTSASAQETYVHSSGEFAFAIPAGWYAHELEGGTTIFTKSETFTLPQGTEGYAIGPQFAVRVASAGEITGGKTYEDWARGSGFVRGSEWLTELNTVTSPSGLTFERAVMNASAADGQTLTYIHVLDDTHFIVISHYPYEEGSADSDAFEDFAMSLELEGDADGTSEESEMDDAMMPAAESARRSLGVKLNVDPKNIEISAVTPQEWSDGCLGLGTAVESCIQMITPGYSVTLNYKGKTYIYRTNESGENVRLQP